MTKEVSKEVDLNAIVNKARLSFTKNEKGLAAQISTGAEISRSMDLDDYVLYPGEHWKSLCGVPGLPFGRVCQIAGRPDSGKSSHAMAFMLSAQKSGHVVILWDTENKFSARRFDKHFGGDSSKLLTVTSRMILEGGDMMNSLISTVLETYPDKKVLVVWDSVGASLDSSENVKELRESRQMAQASKECGMLLRSWVALGEKYKNKKENKERLAVLLINQTYANIGAPGQKESGGQKVEYFSSLIIQLTRKADSLKQKNGVKIKDGVITRAKVRKNHLFESDECVAELDLKVSAGGIELAKKPKAGTEETEAWEVDEEDESES